jgi:hypothetical protein
MLTAVHIACLAQMAMHTRNNEGNRFIWRDWIARFPEDEGADWTIREYRPWRKLTHNSVRLACLRGKLAKATRLALLA